MEITSIMARIFSPKSIMKLTWSPLENARKFATFLQTIVSYGCQSRIPLTQEVTIINMNMKKHEAYYLETKHENEQTEPQAR